MREEPVAVPLRSLLFVPADVPDRVGKALASAADAVVLDLEDAVDEARKPAARAEVARRLQVAEERTVFVRVNGLDTPHAYHDLLEIVPARPFGIILPKVESRDCVVVADWLITQVEMQAGLPRDAIEVMPIIETARGLSALPEIAGAVPRVRRLAFGAIDLASDMGLPSDSDDEVWGHARFDIARVSRAEGCAPPIDTAFVATRDADGLRRATNSARRVGFGGKFCIHPTQIDVIHEAFTPSSEETAHARRLVEAFDAAKRAGQGAVAFEGTMLDKPVVDRARQILAAARE